MVVAFVIPLKTFFDTAFEDSLVEVNLMVFNFLHHFGGRMSTF